MANSRHNIKRGEIRKIGSELTKKLSPLGLEPDEIIFLVVVLKEEQNQHLT